MLIRTKESKFTELELKQIKVIDDLQEEIKTLKLEITELNKDINAYKLVINIRDNTIERIQKLLKAEMKENQQLKKQKDDVVEYIKKNLIVGSILDGEKTYVLNDYTFDYKDLLRMLGEIDVED